MALQRFRWIQPGAAKTTQAMRALQFGEAAPKWVNIVGRQNITISGGRLHVAMLPVLTRKELRSRVRTEYYSAKGASVPKAIYKKLRGDVANVSAPSSRRSRLIS